MEPTLVFISALQIKALLILAASLPWIDYLVICPRPTIQGFLPNAGLRVVCGEQVLETVIAHLSPWGAHWNELPKLAAFLAQKCSQS